MLKVMRVRLFEFMLGAIGFGFATIGADMDQALGCAGIENAKFSPVMPMLFSVGFASGETRSIDFVVGVKLY